MFSSASDPSTLNESCGAVMCLWEKQNTAHQSSEQALSGAVMASRSLLVAKHYTTLKFLWRGHIVHNIYESLRKHIRPSFKIFPALVHRNA